MRKKYLVIGSFAFMQFFNAVQAQTAIKRVSPPEAIVYNYRVNAENNPVVGEIIRQSGVDTVEKVNKTQVDVVYNHYLQDGNNSAITGGIGTEELTVYGPALSVKQYWGNKALNINLGADMISSASTDNIDFVMSSASIFDIRTFGNAVYEHNFEPKDVTIYGGLGFSVESEYFSVGSKIGIIKNDNKNLSQYSAEFQMFNDDLRWGRLTIGVWGPEKLIYPKELRYKEWYDVCRRNSFNLKLGYSKAAGKRTIIGVFPVITYQSGLLSTPFHRIYFTDNTEAVENLPTSRLKTGVGFKWNQFAGSRYVLKNTINPYIDSWGIMAVSIENETAIKFNAIWTLLPNVRFYVQKGSRYFAPYKEHLPTEEFYTSDFDLSSNNSYSAGIGVKYSPYKKIRRLFQFNTVIFRYNYMHRNNGLDAHIFTLSFQIERSKIKN